MQTQQQLRQQILIKRQAITIELQQRAAQSITSTICNIAQFKTSQHLAIYLPHRGEINPTPIMIQAQQKQKECYLPILNTDNQTLLFGLYHQNDHLIKNRYGIPEPTATIKIILPSQLDLVIVPIVAFDESCNRIGAGKGYYDRAFAFIKQKSHHKPYLIGIAYELQKCERFSQNSWDVPLDMVITEKKLYHNDLYHSRRT